MSWEDISCLYNPGLGKDCRTLSDNDIDLEEMMCASEAGSSSFGNCESYGRANEQFDELEDIPLPMCHEVSLDPGRPLFAMCNRTNESSCLESKGTDGVIKREVNERNNRQSEERKENQYSMGSATPPGPGSLMFAGIGQIESPRLTSKCPAIVVPDLESYDSTLNRQSMKLEKNPLSTCLTAPLGPGRLMVSSLSKTSETPHLKNRRTDIFGGLHRELHEPENGKPKEPKDTPLSTCYSVPHGPGRPMFNLSNKIGESQHLKNIRTDIFGVCNHELHGRENRQSKEFSDNPRSTCYSTPFGPGRPMFNLSNKKGEFQHLKDKHTDIFGVCDGGLHGRENRQSKEFSDNPRSTCYSAPFGPGRPMFNLSNEISESSHLNSKSQMKKKKGSQESYNFANARGTASLPFHKNNEQYYSLKEVLVTCKESGALGEASSSTNCLAPSGNQTRASSSQAVALGYCDVVCSNYSPSCSSDSLTDVGCSMQNGNDCGFIQRHAEGIPLDPAMSRRAPAEKFTDASGPIDENKMTFKDDFYGVRQEVIKALNEDGIIKPTRLQQEMLPQLLQGKFTYLFGQPGSGKTLAHALAVLHTIDSSNNTVQALVICPRGHDVYHIEKIYRRCCRYIQPPVRICSAAGFESIGVIKKWVVRNRCHVVIGTSDKVGHLLHYTDWNRTKKILVVEEVFIAMRQQPMNRYLNSIWNAAMHREGQQCIATIGED